MDKLLIVCGPTAVGKTKLGIELAKKFNGEIVSADSRQVYRGMTIGTGKEVGDGKWEMSSPCGEAGREMGYGKWVVNEIPIWLTDVVDPDYRFNVADYKKCADSVLADIWKRRKLPIVVGGTGFYIKALTEEIETIGVKPDWKLRNKLSNCQIDELRIILEKLDLEKLRGMNESDRQNPRRLIRAIEVARDSKSEARNPNQTCLPTGRIQNSNSQKVKNDILLIGLKSSYETLYKRIDQRVEERVKDGVKDEIRGLLKKGYNWENSVLGTTLAYREWQDFFENRASKEQVVQKWKYDEHNFARRQMTWFRKNKKINWFDITKQNWQREVEKIIENWYI